MLFDDDVFHAFERLQVVLGQSPDVGHRFDVKRSLDVFVQVRSGDEPAASLEQRIQRFRDLVERFAARVANADDDEGRLCAA